MSLIKQILLSLLVIVVAVAAWLVFERRDLIFGESSAAAVSAPGAPQTRGSGNAGSGFGGMSAPPVVTALVETDATGAEVRALGTLAAVQEVTIFPQVTGMVTEVAFKPGAQVRLGEVLVRLDDADQVVAVDGAKIAVETADEVRARAEKLAKTNNITQAALSDAVAAARKAEVDLRAAELDLAKRSLKAPFAGIVGLSDVSVGDLVTTQKTIVTLADTSTMTVTFDVPERVASQVALGQEVKATAEGLAGHVVAGEVTAIDNRIDPEARTMRVKASLANEGEVLKPGMSVVATLTFPGEPHPAVPSLAVQWDRQGSFVWKLDGDVVHRTPVQIVARRSGVVTVAGDLEAGERVVTEGVLRLREGIKITRVDEESGPDASPKPAPLKTPAAGAAAASPGTKG